MITGSYHQKSDFLKMIQNCTTLFKYNLSHSVQKFVKRNFIRKVESTDSLILLLMSLMYCSKCCTKQYWYICSLRQNVAFRNWSETYWFSLNSQERQAVCFNLNSTVIFKIDKLARYSDAIYYFTWNELKTNCTTYVY